MRYTSFLSMSPEQSSHPPLTLEQAELADFLLSQCGLDGLADVPFEMMGEGGTVRYGLGRCAHHLMDMTPEEIRGMVMGALEQQGHLPS